ncbi:hypothetical protein C2G38_2164171 [Gigaspora rosea]|uniref:Uncharacterized protein n=1 Tax=Gigaspora rosea TaxID=44941 RepID=A0A397VYM9_9GLOM|nr:hypothetical protein C2G38_2164171 [Gigaspora rosea]CAG8694641.1 7999_t:CDS:1 [Gigaspora rosea]
MKQSEYTDTEPTEAGTPKEEKDWWISGANEEVIEEKEEDMEAFMVLVNDKDDDKTVQDEGDLSDPTPIGYLALTPRAPSMWYHRLVLEYCHSLAFTSLTRSYGRIFHLYVHPIHLEHYALEVLNRVKTVYMTEHKGFCLIAHDPRNLLVLREWIIAGIRQELVRREYFWAIGVDLGYNELIDVNAVRTQLRKDR